MFDIEKLADFYKGKKVLVTGHTGFKGSYLTLLLSLMGAQVYGYSLKPNTEPALFDIMYGKGMGEESKIDLRLKCSVPLPDMVPIVESHIADIRDFDELEKYYKWVMPDVVLHLAAQPIVRESYRVPRETYETNVMGTVNLLECVRRNPGCASLLNVTTDKVYLNEERPGYAYKEDDKLDGYDPYSNSKSCSDIITHSYAASFLKTAGTAVSTARAGNVIGGGDFSLDRIVPDCVRAFVKGEPIHLRNPRSVRPYQHVLEPLFVYLEIAYAQALNPSYAGWYNVGPDKSDCVTTGELAELLAGEFDEGVIVAAGEETGEDPSAPVTAGEDAGEDTGAAMPAGEDVGEDTGANEAAGKETGEDTGAAMPAGEDAGEPHEAGLLMLDNSRIKEVFGWRPVWHIDEAVKAVSDWTRAWMMGDECANEEMLRQVKAYLSDANS